MSFNVSKLKISNSINLLKLNSGNAQVNIKNINDKVDVFHSNCISLLRYSRSREELEDRMQKLEAGFKSLEADVVANLKKGNI